MTGPLVPNDDAELFDLWQERQSEVADWEAICEREPPNGPRNPEYRAWLAESMGAGRLVAEIEREIADTPAQGYAGLLNKARLAVELDDATDSDPYAPNSLALLPDLERLAGDAAARRSGPAHSGHNGSGATA